MPKLADPLYLALKAALAVGLAHGATLALGVPDPLSATFVAVICTSPTVLAGVRRAVAQGLGSVVGGCLAAAASLLPVPSWATLPAAVGATVALAFWTGLGGGYLVAAFTALYVTLVPRGDPLQTLEVRLLAVGLGAAAAMAVNSTVSSLAYASIFRKRVERTVGLVAAAIAAAADRPDALSPLFPVLAELQSEIALALQELRWRRSSRTLAEVRRAEDVVQALARIAHLARDLALAAGERGGLSAAEREALSGAAAMLRGEGPAPEALPAAPRLGAALARFQALRRPGGAGGQSG